MYAELMGNHKKQRIKNLYDNIIDIVTDSLTAFGLKAEDASSFCDVLAKTSASSNTTVEMLGEAFKNVAPLAGAMGYNVSEVSLALGLMA